MSSKFILILTLLLVSACGTSNENEIHLFNGISFNVHHEEKILPKTLEQQKAFALHFVDSSFQCPLYHVISDSSDTYKLFLTVPVNTNIKDLYSYFKKASELDSSMRVDSDSTSYVYVSIKSDTICKARLFKSFDTSLMNVNAVSLNPLQNDSIISLNGLSSRFQYDENH